MKKQDKTIDLKNLTLKDKMKYEIGQSKERWLEITLCKRDRENRRNYDQTDA